MTEIREEPCLVTFAKRGVQAMGRSDQAAARERIIESLEHLVAKVERRAEAEENKTVAYITLLDAINIPSAYLSGNNGWTLNEAAYHDLNLERDATFTPNLLNDRVLRVEKDSLLIWEVLAGTPKNDLSSLSRREQEVHTWRNLGKSAEETGIILGISRRTVEKHLENIKCKVGGKVGR